MASFHGTSLRPSPAPGFTLPEVLLASAVLAMIVAAVAQAVTAGQVQTYDALHRVRATELAEAMLDEIRSKPYLDPEGGGGLGRDSGEGDRTQFDNADDYHGLSEAAGGVRDPAGDAYTGPYTVFSRGVVMQYTTRIGIAGESVPGLNATITVTDDTGRSWTLTGFIAQPPTE